MYKFPLLSHPYTYMYICIFFPFCLFRSEPKHVSSIAFVSWNGNPLQYSCPENSMDRGAWWATVHGVTKSQTRLNDEHKIFQMNSFPLLYCHLFMKEFPMCWISLIAFLWCCLTWSVIPIWPDSALNFCKEAINVVFIFHGNAPGIICHLLCIFLEYLDWSLDLHTYYQCYLSIVKFLRSFSVKDFHSHYWS